MGEIYKITCTITNKIYIGKTEINTQERWKQHCYVAFLQSHKDYNFPFHRAIRKYGIKNFSIIVIDRSDSQQELSNKEVFWINFYNSYKNGYNASLGGDGHSKYNYDMIINYYFSHNCSILNTRQHFHIYDQVIYSALKSKNINYLNLQKPKNNKRHFKQEKIYCIELNKIFNTMSEIDKYFNKQVHSNIRRCLDGITKKAYGYHWKIIKEGDEL